MEMLTEQIDLDALERALIGSAMGLTFRECQTLIKYARALESRASNAGGAVAAVRTYTYEGIARNGVRQEAVMLDGAPELPDGSLLYTHPAPASKEPVADERCNRCGHENHSGSCVNVHPDKTPIKQKSTLDGLRDCLQKMVDANLEDSLGPNHLALCLKQMAYEALELVQKVQPVADERAMVRGVPKSIINAITAYGDARADGKDTGEAIGNAVSAIRAALATAQTPEGWRLVPVEPTRKMLCAWRDAQYTDEYYESGKGIGHCYERMLAAAPAKPEGV
jgi:hypothetical protein